MLGMYFNHFVVINYLCEGWGMLVMTRQAKLRDIFFIVASKLKDIAAGVSLAFLKEDIPHCARAGVLDLLYGALRELNFYQHIVHQLWRTPPKDMVIEYLLIAAVRRLYAYPDRPYVTVSEAVNALIPMRLFRYNGFVNALLRRFLAEKELLEQNAESILAVKHRLPDWWLERLQKDWPEHWTTIAKHCTERPPLGLRTNFRNGVMPQGYHKQLLMESIDSSCVSEDGLIVHDPVPVDKLPLFKEGGVSVQDIGAQYAAYALSPESGQRVLDACASPGGKAAHLLERFDIELVALEVNEKRALRIHETLDRLGLSARVQVCDAGDIAIWWDGCFFDRVLLDAPCSASGVARRYPDTKWLRRNSDIFAFAEKQLHLLIRLWEVLKEGGNLLYVTCSVFQEENDFVIDRFLASTANAKVSPLCLPDLDSVVRTRYGIQLLPSILHDGFFYCGLSKYAAP